MYYFYSISSFSQLLAALYLFYFITFSANNLIVFYLILILINLFAKVAEGCVRRKLQMEFQRMLQFVIIFISDSSNFLLYISIDIILYNSRI